MTFKIIIPCYNAAQWIRRCVQSVISQTVSDWEVVVVNDGSTDETAAELQTLSDSRISVISNQHNQASSLGSIIRGIDAIAGRTAPDDVIINVDGDDCLENVDVLACLQDVYTDHDIWLTYGNYCNNVWVGSVCHYLAETRTYRSGGINQWCTSHLRTFRKHLFDRVNRVDFLDYDGKPYQFAGDLALMYPLVELAGPRRIKFIDKCLYVYNVNAGGEGGRSAYQSRITPILARIYSRPPYTEVP